VTKYLLGRVLAALPVLFVCSVLIFALGRLLPGDPVSFIAGSESTLTREQVDAIRRDYGLDQPIYTQYAIWIGKIATGDFGRSFLSRRPVTEVIAIRMLPTAQIAVQSLLLATIVGVWAGIFSAIGRNTWKDWLATLLTLAGAAVPFFLTASILMIIFALRLRWLPASGYIPLSVDPLGSLRTTLLPSLVLSLALAAVLARQTRSSLMEVLQQQYITTARAKGLREIAVLRAHALKNAFLPVLTILGFQLAYLFGGAVITETIFAIPGMGRLLVDSVGARDYAVMQALVLLVSVTVVVANLLVDLVYGFLDPRIRLVRRGN
jgi:peptide/nickel transport system permease protein